MSDELFYLTSKHGDCGTNVMFHNKDGNGYGTDLDKLHVFTLEEVQHELKFNQGSLPLLKSEVDKMAIKAVDMQYLDRAKNVGKTPFYAMQIPRLFNGNDIAFLDRNNKVTFDYASCYYFTLQEALGKDGIMWNTDYLDTICRSTFQRKNINTRKMITGAGIKYKKPRKQRPTTGKVRWNCPACGKINWQYNPYEFDTCSDIKCNEEWGNL